MIISTCSKLCREFFISIPAPKHYIFLKFRSILPKLLFRLENNVWNELYAILITFNLIVVANKSVKSNARYGQKRRVVFLKNYQNIHRAISEKRILRISSTCRFLSLGDHLT